MFRMLLLILLCFGSLAATEEDSDEQLPEELLPSEVEGDGVDFSSGGSGPINDEDFTEAPGDITELLEEAVPKKEGLLRRYIFPGFEKRVIEEFENINEKLNLDIGVAYTSIYQRASQSLGQYEAAGADFRIFGTWKLLDKGPENWGIFGFSGQERHKYTSISPSLLGPTIGLLSRTVAGFNQQDFSLVQLWWEQHLGDDFFIIRFGKVDTSDYIDYYRYQSPSLGFLTTPLEDMPSIPYPQNGPGFAAVLRPWPDAYMTVAVSERGSRKEQVRFDTFFERPNYFTAMEFGYQPDIEGLGKGDYHVTFWYADHYKHNGFTIIPYGKGFALSAEQVFSQNFIPFARFSYADGLATLFRQSCALGFGMENPFGRGEDVYAIGFGWKQPFTQEIDPQYVIETFYRLQLTPTMQITPDLEIFINRPLIGRRDVPLVFTIRFRWDL